MVLWFSHLSSSRKKAAIAKLDLKMEASLKDGQNHEDGSRTSHATMPDVLYLPREKINSLSSNRPLPFPFSHPPALMQGRPSYPGS